MQSRLPGHFLLLLLVLMLAPACVKPKLPISKETLPCNDMHVEYSMYTMQRVCVRVEGVECSCCLQDVHDYLQAIEGVQSVRLMRDYDAGQVAYFVFNYAAAEQFDVDYHNKQLAPDGFHMDVL